MSEGRKLRVFSKVILSGEHTVLRGGLAVVAPLKDEFLDAELRKADSFKIEMASEIEAYKILIEGTFEKAFELLEICREDVSCRIQVKALVPLAKGLGGSAAVCVFVAKVMATLGFFTFEKVFSFAIELENMFHGESSGLDIAGCLAPYVQVYQRGKAPKKVNLTLDCYVFALTSTGESGCTETCIEKVLDFKRKNKNLFLEQDDLMDRSSRLLLEGLENNKADLIVKGLTMAEKVFSRWALETEKMKSTMEDLKSRGALAVKPTGSGLGGYILSFWERERFESLKDKCNLKILELT